MTLVIDASVALAWCFAAEQTPPVVDIIRRVEREGAHAPVIWPIELQNVLLVGERRGRLTADHRARLTEYFRELAIALDPDPGSAIWDETPRLAASHNLTVYDASYLELAHRLA